MSNTQYFLTLGAGCAMFVIGVFCYGYHRGVTSEDRRKAREYEAERMRLPRAGTAKRNCIQRPTD